MRNSKENAIIEEFTHFIIIAMKKTKEEMEMDTGEKYFESSQIAKEGVKEKITG